MSITVNQTPRVVTVDATTVDVITAGAQGPEGAQGPAGPAGADGPPGPGFATGGTTGQVLVKASNTNYDTEWSTVSGTGTVTTVSVVTANGVSGSVANPTTTPAITLTLGAITPTTVAASSTVTGSNLSGTNTGDTITTSTPTNISGVLKGNGSTVTTATNLAVTDGSNIFQASQTIFDQINLKSVGDVQGSIGYETNNFLITAETAPNLKLEADGNNAVLGSTGLTLASGNYSGGGSGLTGIPNTGITGLGTASVKDIGTSGATVPLLNAGNTWGGRQTFLNSSGVKILDTDASAALGLVVGSNLSTDRTLTITTGDASRMVTLSGDTTLSGTNTGDQTITLTGDVTGSGTGSFATTIGATKVTNAMLAGSITAAKLVGSDIATVGTITSGTWTGTAVAVANGGTGATDAATARTNLGLGTAAVKDTGTSGATVPLLNGANSWSSAQTFINSSGVKIQDTDASNTLGLIAGSNLSADRTLTVTTGDANRTVTLNADTTLSGTNTGDQTITLTGNVTGSGTGSFATTIAAGVVTNSMLAGSIQASKLVGSDIATVGTITSGTWTGTTIAIANGGTGQTSANSAFNALAPSQSTNSGKYLTTNATDTSWVAVAAPMSPTFALALGTPATTGTTKTNSLIAPRAGTITKAWAYANTGPTGADLIFDVNLNGSTIWSTQANRLKIVANAQSGNQTSFNTTAVVAGDLLTIDIDQVGSTIAGQDLTVTIYLTAAL